MKHIQIWSDLGNLYLQANAFEAALDAYNKAIEQGYQAWDMYRNMAIAFDGQGKTEESISMYLKSIELLAENKEKAVLFSKLGDSYRKISDYEKAITAFKSAIDLDPGNPELCNGLNDLQQDLERLFDLEAQNLTSGDVSQLDVTFGNGVVIVETTSNLDANTADGFASSLEKSGDAKIEDDFSGNTVPSVDINIEGIFDNGMELSGSDDFVSVDTSLSKMDDYEDLEPEDSVRMTLLLTLGIKYWRNGSLEEAEGCIRDAISIAVKINNNWFEALCFHALALVKTASGDVLGAINAYMKAVSLAPDKIFPWNNLGNLYSSIDENDEAISAFQKAIRYNPDDASGWDGLADVYTKLGKLEEAIAAYQLANIFEKKLPGVDAIKAYEKAFSFYKVTLSAIDKNNLSSMAFGTANGDHLDQNDSNEEAGLGVEAISQYVANDIGANQDKSVDAHEYQDGVSIFSASDGLINDLGNLDLAKFPKNEFEPIMPVQEEIDLSRALVDNLDCPEEEKQFTEHVEIQMENGELIDGDMLPLVSTTPLSDQSYNLEKIAGTIASYEAVVRQNPNSDRAWDALGNLYRINQRLEDAITAYEQAVALDSKKYVYHYQLGTLYAAKKQYNEAIQEIRKVVELNPSFTFAHCALASYLRKVGMDEEAKHHIEIALPFMKNEKEYDRACFESIRGNIDGALELLSIALEKKQTTLEWIRRDLDLDFIRHDPRYSLLESKYSQSFINY